MSKNAATLAAIEILAAGRHVASDGTVHEITRADLTNLAQSYDPQLSEAPIVIGHPTLNAPAYGWVKSLIVDGDKLLAEPHQVDAEFAEIVNAGRYKKRSASLWGETSPGNPTPGKRYLRHVGFLGAQPPAVKGLRDVQLSSNAEGVIDFSSQSERFAFRAIAELFRSVRDYFVESQGVEKADKLIPAWTVDTVADAAREPEPAMSYAAPAAHVQEITVSNQTTEQREQELKRREAAVAAAEAAQRRAAVVSFASTLVADGRLLPRQQAPVVELLMTLESAAEISFAEGDATVKRSPADEFKKLLGELPKWVDYTEKGKGPLPPTAANFAAPPDFAVDQRALEVHARAIEFQRANPNTPYLDAVKAVSR